MMPLLQRRLAAEWDLLQELALINPGRLSCLSAADTTIHGTLHGIAVLPVVSLAKSDIANEPQMISTHRFCLRYPVHFPAVPMELYLQTPVRHPNIHPRTGFVCLWERHRADHSVELAMHKLVAMLSGHLFNDSAPHVMQPGALASMADAHQPPPLLIGVHHSAADALPRPANGRRRLS